MENSNKRKVLLARYNMVPNLLWSIINLTPICIFCFTLVKLKLIYIFLLISFIPLFFKNSFIDKFQIAKSIEFYKKLGVHKINSVAQNGSIINKILKNKFPDHRIVVPNKSSISNLIAQTYIFEKFHLMTFLFFNAIIIYSLIYSYWYWAIIILLTNIAYNIYPNLLQQYIRIKLRIFNKKQKTKVNEHGF